MMGYVNINENNRNYWISQVLSNIPNGHKILDAGAGEQVYKKFCEHLDYTSQDFNEYSGAGDNKGYQTGKWDTSKIDIVCDIVDIPEPDSSYDAILCSEVIEHIPDALAALKEFHRLLRSGGKLIVTAPFSSLVHFAPYHYCSGFSKYWYELHLPQHGFTLTELSPNGDWFSVLCQETARLGSMERRAGNWSWPLAYGFGFLFSFYAKIRSKKSFEDYACFGWHCIASKN